MRTQLRMGAAVLLLLGGTSLALAGGADKSGSAGMKMDKSTTGNTGSSSSTSSTSGQAELNLTPQQEKSITQSVASWPEQSASGFTPKVGAKVPQSVSLKEAPASLASQVPEAKDKKILKLKDQVLLVNDQREVVAMIDAMGNTGSSGSSGMSTGSGSKGSTGMSGSGSSSSGSSSGSSSSGSGMKK